MKVARTRVPRQCEFDAMVGANLQYMRKFRKLSMQKVAEQIPFTFQQLQKYEKGRNTISAYKLLMLCKIYKVEIAEIVKESFIETHQSLINKVLDQAYMSDNEGKQFTMPDGKTVFFPEGITETALEKFKEQYMKKVNIGKTPQDAGYLKPQVGIGSMEEITKEQMEAALNKAKAEGYLEPKVIVGSLEKIKDQLKKDGIDPEETILPTLRKAAKVRNDN